MYELRAPQSGPGQGQCPGQESNGRQAGKAKQDQGRGFRGQGIGRSKEEVSVAGDIWVELA